MASGIFQAASGSFPHFPECFSSAFRGTGYSSLNTLKDLLFNEVKIDRKFLSDSLTENAKIVLQEVFHMLKRMGKSIVCEGVETENIAEFLKEEGCDEIQGFLYYRPMCEEDFEKLIHTPAA